MAVTPNRRSLALVLVSVSVLALGLSAAFAIDGASPANAAGEKPNVVVFLLDDTSPHDGRLWGASDELGHDPTLTPAIYDRFVAHGTKFTNAIAETPLCCPARGNLLTGLHTHNHLVKENDVRLFNPAEHIGKAMGEAGYASYWIGKYLNKTNVMTPQQWMAHSAGWSEFDVFASKLDDSTVGYYTDYTLFTKQGILMPPEHSTQMVADRAVARFAATPANQPIFAMLSVYNTHAPHIPMPQFVGDPRCDAIPPWNPPNYNEADVSDKPPYIQVRPLYAYPDGWPMETLCEEMLGVDWAVDRVVDELEAEGRLDNTMLVFTADNGMDWGSHRLDLKQSPYSTPVPLYVSWPARLGNNPDTIEEYVSNIDLAPTFCDVAGCQLGPFPGGQSGPDGVSIMPLLTGNANATLGRDALLETSWASRVWSAVRTTDLHELGLWHYVTHSNGFKELYNVDPDEDPYELENLAYDPEYADIREELADRLLELMAEGRPEATASLTIIQDSLPNSAENFSFTSDLGSFMLDDDSNATLPRKRVFTGLAPGSYTFTQVAPAGWSLQSLRCGAGHDVDLAASTVTVNLLPDDQVTCTFKNATLRPDARVAVAAPAPVFKGDNVYATTPQKKQTLRWDAAPAGQTLDFVVGLQNDSKIVDSFTVRGVGTGSAAIGVTYLVDNVDVSADVRAGTYTLPELQTDGIVYMLVRVTITPDAPTGIKMKVVVTQRSVALPSRSDVVRVVVTR